MIDSNNLPRTPHPEKTPVMDNAMTQIHSKEDLLQESNVPGRICMTRSSLDLKALINMLT